MNPIISHPPRKPVGSPKPLGPIYGDFGGCSHSWLDDLVAIPTRIRRLFMAWWQLNSPQHARRVRERNMAAELVALATEYKRDELMETIRWAIPREDGWR